MGAAIQLKRLGITDFTILEREDDLGGTWHVNRYPGLAVDIASVTYSYSFEPNPYWAHWYARGPELKKYAEHVADKYDLRRHMRFDAIVEGARWDEDAQEWEVRLAGGERLRAAYLITATGFLSQPKLPDIEGVGDFAGTVLHTAEWDDTADLDGKRVAIIGTGATAVQLIPKLAKRAGHLTVFQRTPIWVTPKLDFRMPKAVQTLFAAAPAHPADRAYGEHRAARGDHGRRGAALPAGQGLQQGRGTRSRSGTCTSRSPTPSCAASSPPTTPSAASGRRSPTTTTRRSPATTSTSRRRRSSGSRRRASSPPTAARPRSTCSCWPPASTCGTPTSRRSRSSAATARTSASGGARPGSRPTRASPSPASRTCSAWRRRTPTRGCRTSRPSRRR